MWTAFGICLGFVASVAFQNTDFLGPNSQWRWMLGSTSIPPLIVMLQVYFCPESPRWYMEKGRYDKAFNSMLRLRNHAIQATRDMYYAYKLLEVERSQRQGRNLFKEFFTVRRNRRAAQSAWFTMVSFFDGCQPSLTPSSSLCSSFAVVSTKTPLRPY